MMRDIHLVRKTAFLAVTLLLFTGCGKSKAELTAELYGQGLDAIERGNPKGAIEFLRSAVEKDPGFTDARFQLANALVAEGKDALAEKEYRQVLEQEPDRTMANLGLIAIHVRMKKSDLALQEARKFLRSSPDDAEVLELMGLASLSKNCPEAAEKYFLQAMTADPSRHSAKLALAGLYQSRGNTTEARRLAQEVTAVDQQNPQAARLLAELELREAHRVNPGDLAILVRRGDLLENQGNFKGAAKFYTDALARDPDFLPALFAQSLLMQKTGDKAGAIRTNRAILAKSSDYVPSINNLAQLLVDEPQPEKVQEGLNLAFTAFKLEPENPSVIDTLGYALIKSGRRTEAIKLLEKAASLLPDNREVAKHLALAKRAGQ